MLRFKKTILISFFFLLNTQVYAKSSILDDVSTFIDILNGAVTFLKTLEDMGKSSSKNIRETKSDYLASEKKRKDAYEIEQSGNIRIATNLYKESTDLDPTNKKAWHGYGGALLKENKYSEAEQAFSEAIFLDDSTSSSWKYLGSTYEQWGKLKSAAFCYAEAYKREKDNKKIKQGIENIFITLKEKGIYTKITNHGDMYFFTYNANGAKLESAADDGVIYLGISCDINSNDSEKGSWSIKRKDILIETNHRSLLFKNQNMEKMLKGKCRS